MTYAFRITSADDYARRVLVEFGSIKQMEAANAQAEGRHQFVKASVSQAHQHVRNGRIHETALWIDGGKVRRA